MYDANNNGKVIGKKGPCFLVLALVIWWLIAALFYIFTVPKSLKR